MVQYWNGTELGTEDVLVSYTVYSLHAHMTGIPSFLIQNIFDNHIIQVNIPRNNCKWKHIVLNFLGSYMKV